MEFIKWNSMLYCRQCLLSFGHCNFLDLLVFSFLPIVGQLYGYTMIEYTSDPGVNVPSNWLLGMVFAWTSIFSFLHWKTAGSVAHCTSVLFSDLAVLSCRKQWLKPVAVPHLSKPLLLYLVFQRGILLALATAPKQRAPFPVQSQWAVWFSCGCC